MKKSIALLSLCGVIISCQHEGAENNSVQNEVVFYAQTEQPTSKTSVDNAGKVYWLPGDAIKVFNSFSGLTAKLTSTNEEPSSSTTFKGNSEEAFRGRTYALYPYSDEASLDGESILIKLPTEQTAVAGSFADDLFISVAMSDNQHLQFYNVCGGLCFTVVQDNITSVVLRGNNYMAGPARASIDNGDVRFSSANMVHEVTLSTPEGESFIPGERYYIVCYPGEWGGGYTLIFTKKDGTQAVKKSLNPVEIKRSTFGVLLDADKGLEFVDAQSGIEKEHSAMLAIWRSLNGENWEPEYWDSYLTWKEENPITEWSGLRFNELGRISRIDISTYLADGTLPDVFDAFEYLEELEILGHLSGALPASIGRLPKLKSMYIRGGVSGPIPDLSGLVNLESLIIGGANFACAMPSSIGSLKNLKNLSITNCGLTGSIPTEIGNLESLEYLDLSTNRIEGPIPSSICNLTNLKTLNLESNILTGPIPAEIGNLVNLESLCLRGHSTMDEFENDSDYTNRISGEIPSSMANLHNICSIDLSDNQISGTIPDFIWNLPNLRALDLGFNNLSGGLSSEIGNAKNLVSLNLSSNSLSGTLPEELWNCSALASIDLSSWYLRYGVFLENKNSFTGELSSNISNLSNLCEFSVSNNSFYGEIPMTIISLHNLNTLKLSDNSFSGSIPNGIKDLSALSFFWCHGNKLSG